MHRDWITQLNQIRRNRPAGSDWSSHFGGMGAPDCFGWEHTIVSDGSPSWAGWEHSDPCRIEWGMGAPTVVNWFGWEDPVRSGGSTYSSRMATPILVEWEHLMPPNGSVQCNRMESRQGSYGLGASRCREHKCRAHPVSQK